MKLPNRLGTWSLLLLLVILSPLHAQTPAGISNYTQALIRKALRENTVKAREPVSNAKPVIASTNVVLASQVTNVVTNAPAVPMGRKETLVRTWDEAISNGWQAALKGGPSARAAQAAKTPPQPTNAPAPAVAPVPASTNGGLVLYLPFEEGKGSVTHDASGYGLSGEANDPKLPMLWTNGIKGNAISTANTNLFRIPHAKHFSGLRAITVSCWINSTSAPDNVVVWVSKHAGGARGEFFLGGLTTNTIRWTVVNAKGARMNLDARCPPLADGKWHHILGQYDSYTLRVYFDGMHMGFTNLIGPVSSYEAPILIGDYDWKPYRYPSFHYSGLIDEVKIWNRFLSAEEVLQDYQKR